MVSAVISAAAGSTTVSWRPWLIRTGTRTLRRASIVSGAAVDQPAIARRTAAGTRML